MKPCDRTCPLSSEDQAACESLVKIEMTYYDASLALIIFDNPMLDQIDPEMLGILANKAFEPLQKQGAVGKIGVFSPRGHA